MPLSPASSPRRWERRCGNNEGASSRSRRAWRMRSGWPSRVLRVLSCCSTWATMSEAVRPATATRSRASGCDRAMARARSFVSTILRRWWRQRRPEPVARSKGRSETPPTRSLDRGGCAPCTKVFFTSRRRGTGAFRSLIKVAPPFSRLPRARSWRWSRRAAWHPSVSRK